MCIVIALLIMCQTFGRYVHTFVHVLSFSCLCKHAFHECVYCTVIIIIGYSEFLWGNQMTKVGHGQTK